MIKNNLKFIQDLLLEVREFRKYLKEEFIKFVNLNCRKTKKYIIFKNEKKANLNNAKKVFKEFLKTIDIEKYKKLLKLEAKFNSFFGYEDAEIEPLEVREEEKKINIYDDFTKCFYILNDDYINLLILEDFCDLLFEVICFTSLHYDGEEGKMKYLSKKKAKKINKIIGIIYDEI